MTAYEAGQAVGYIIGVGLAGLVIWLAIRGTRGGERLQMRVGEVRIADIYAECPQVKFSGFIAVGSTHQGKLILTNQRLIFTNPHEKKTALDVWPKQIVSVQKGTKGPVMTLELDYLFQVGQPRHLTFTQLGAIPGVKIDPKAQLPIGMFIDKLTVWRLERVA